MRTSKVGISSRSLGQLPDGQDVTCWRLERDGIVVEVLTYGARLHAVHVPDRHGAVDNVIVGPLDLAGHLADRVPFAGGIVGRWANRLGEGRVQIDGVAHELAANEGTTTLHGGPDGFDKRLWSARSVSDSRGPAVEMRLVSPDGDNGFPGALEVTATYRLGRGGTLSLAIEAVTDAPTVVNLTTHAHWDLSGGLGAGGHRLRVPADRVLEVDDDLLPTAVLPVAGTPFDLRDPMPVAEVLDDVELDHCYLLTGSTAAVLSSPDTGRQLVMTTNQPCVQVYAGGQLPGRHSAIALEPQVAPDAPNRPDLDIGPRGVLRPGETYRHWLTMSFDTV